MIQTIKELWNEWKELIWWKKVLLFIPLILLIIFIIFIPIRRNEDDINKEILASNKKISNKAVDTLEQQDKKLEDKQKKIKQRRKELEKKVKNRDEETKSIIDEINDADDNLSKLVDLHRRINTRKKSGEY